jgi:hypothetical protein
MIFFTGMVSAQESLPFPEPSSASKAAPVALDYHKRAPF